jgi:hypothetical protein
MAYLPNNVNVYAAAFAGSYSAMAASVPITDSVSADYSSVASVAAVFAQAVDTAWGAVTVPNSYDLTALENASNNVFLNRVPSPVASPLNTQANYTTLATAIVAMVQQGDTNASTQNITFPGSAPGSNRAYGSGTATTAGQATITVIAACKLIAKTSGIFKAWCNLSWASLTAADVATLTVKVFTDNVAGTPLTLGNAGSIGFGSAGVAQPGNTAVATNGAFTANAGAGITITGGSAGYTADTKVFTQGTAATGAILTWENVVSLASPTSTETPIVIGKTCLVTVSLTNSAAARATGAISIGMFEL